MTGLARSGKVSLLLLFCWTVSTLAVEKPDRDSRSPEYHRYIDPLIDVPDFGTRYLEDGAADNTVLYPQGTEPPYGYLSPAKAVVELVRLRNRGLPLLIDCLSDGRVTHMRFGGNAITKEMNVPVGYVCLDILMNEVTGRPAIDPDCADDGLGACVNYGFYFRPDDYYECSERSCFLRPWVSVVKRKWKAAYDAHQLRLHNPYDSLPVDEYKEYKTLRN